MRLTPTPAGVLEQMASHPLRDRCWRWLLLRDHSCEGRKTWEHGLLHGGRRVNEFWAIVRLCAKAHSVDQFQDSGIIDKGINRWIAFSRIEDWDEVERKYPRANWRSDYEYLVGVYGRPAWPKRP